MELLMELGFIMTYGFIVFALMICLGYVITNAIDIIKDCFSDDYFEEEE